MTICGYLRAIQEIRTDTPDRQKESILDYCERTGITVDSWVQDAASSGARNIFQRAAGRELVKSARRGDTVIVSAAAVVGRTLGELAELIRVLVCRGVTLVVIDMPGQRFAPEDGYSLRFADIVVAFERDAKRNRSASIRNGMLTRKFCGGRIGPHPPFGWKHEKTNSRSPGKPRYILAVDEAERALMDLALEQSRRNVSFASIAQTLNDLGHRNRIGSPWNRQSVERLIKAAKKIPRHDDGGSTIPIAR